MIVNAMSLIHAMPIKGMHGSKQKAHGVSHGLSEAGYDIRIKQRVCFRPHLLYPGSITNEVSEGRSATASFGRFVLASAMEEFEMPANLVGVVHDKSTWARQGLSVFNTVIEPGWGGFLTLELVYHGNQELIIPAGAGIAQVLFHTTTDNAQYIGKYQNQANEPVPAKLT